MSEFFAGRGARWLLLGSLALNLALLVALLLPLAGIVGGRHMHRGGPLATPWTLRELLPRERWDALRPVLQQHRHAMRSAMRAAGDGRRAVDAELRRDPFDRLAFEAALAEVRVRDQATAAALHAMLTDAIVQLDREERAALADRLWRRGGRHERHARGPDGSAAGPAEEPPPPR